MGVLRFREGVPVVEMLTREILRFDRCKGRVMFLTTASGEQRKVGIEREHEFDFPSVQEADGFAVMEGDRPPA